MQEITPALLVKRTVLFIVETKHGIKPEEYVTDGSVLSVDEENKEAMICFLYDGYKSATEQVPFSHILSVEDAEDGKPINSEGFRGTGHDLRNREPFGTHMVVASAQ